MAILSHNQMRELLAGESGKKFVFNATYKLYDWANKLPDYAINYRVFRELTVRYYNGNKNKWGDEKPDDYRFDAVVLVEPGYRAQARRQTFDIGIELKGDADDLKNDAKIAMYLGWTDLFFIGVPKALVADAVSKAESVMVQDAAYENKIGVMDVESGQIYMWPQKNNVSLENQLAVKDQIIYNYCMKEDKVIAIDCKNIEPLPLPSPNLQAPTSADVALPTTEPVNFDTSSDASNKGAEKVLKDKSKSNHLTEEERHERAEKRAQNREKVIEQKKEIEQRNSTLMPSTRNALAGLSDRDNLLFWTIRDAADRGLDAKDLPVLTGQSTASISRSIASLKRNGLIELDGSKKTGKYKTIGDAAKDSRCISCKLQSKCQGNALLCRSYQEA